MAYRVLHAGDAHWRASTLTQVCNTDLARQLGATALGARLWRLAPGQTITRHRHRAGEELYLVLDGTGRMRVDADLLTLEPLSAVLVEAASVRQPFNDTQDDQLWLIAGAPPDAPTAQELSEEDLAFLYPDGPAALPPELGG
jgi:uncharacterized cupin superfamily protein